MATCKICKSAISEKEETVQTPCSHTFHQACMNLWIQQLHTVCPDCKLSLNPAAKQSQMSLRSKDKDNQAAATGAKSTGAKPKQPQDPPQNNPQQQQQQQPQNAPSSEIMDEGHLRNLITSIVSEGQVALLGDLETNLVQRMEMQLESSMARLLQQMNVNNNAYNHMSPINNNSPQIEIMTQPNPPTNIRTSNQFNRHGNSMHMSDVSSGNNSSHIARLIKSWEIKFDGTTKLSVESFIYRLESQVIDNLNGNFTQLCENIQSLLTDAAKDWYWSYRRSVDRVTWPSFCEALRTNFEEHKTDTEIKETIRNRKQGPTETFDDYRNAIYKLTEKLYTQIPESELVEVMQRGLRPRVRQQLLYLPIRSVAELRKLCLKGEHLLNEINKTPPIIIKKPFIRNKVEELEIEVDPSESISAEAVEVDEIKVTNLNCWNCRKKGHRYYDCLEDRTVFCYGCGEINTYKPTCAKCNPGNRQRSETCNVKPRYDPKQ